MGFFEKLDSTIRKAENFMNSDAMQNMAQRAQGIQMEVQEYKTKYSKLGDRELFEEMKRQKSGSQNTAIKTLLKERGWYFDYDESKWKKR